MLTIIKIANRQYKVYHRVLGDFGCIRKNSSKRMQFFPSYTVRHFMGEKVKDLRKK